MVRGGLSRLVMAIAGVVMQLTGAISMIPQSPSSSEQA